jgi:rod shape determining protein RodA
MNEKINLWKRVDWVTIGLYVLLLIGGVVSICGASFDFDNPTLFSFNTRPGMQLVWIAASSLLIFFIMFLDRNVFETFAYAIYGIFILLLIFTILVAPNTRETHAWLVITNSIRIQPAEFAKFATALALAKHLGSYDFNMLTFRNMLISVIIIALPMLCVVLQNDTGSALVFLAFSLVLYREGMSGYVLLMSVCAALFFVIVLKYNEFVWTYTPLGMFVTTCIVLVLLLVILRFAMRETRLAKRFLLIILIAGAVSCFVAYFFEPFNYVRVTTGLIVLFALVLIAFAVRRLVWKFLLVSLFALFSIGVIYSVDDVFEHLQQHQQKRIKVTLGIENDARTSYNVDQSVIAIGAGRGFGKGFLNGTQTKLKFVPEQDTDFIFSTVGEEFGFAGTLTVLFLYGFFLLRVLFLAERQDTAFGRVYGYGVASVFFIHLLINVGMVCGLMPVIGIPLPFFSYGGSSLWGFTILLFILLRLDAGRK